MTKVPLFKNTQTELINSDFEEFKKRFQLTRFPTNLQMLYQRYNGGVINVDGPIIHKLFSLKFGKSTLEEVREDLIEEELVPEEYLVFGINGGGDFFAMDIGEFSESSYGNIFFIRQDTLEIEKVADTLEEFFGVDSALQF